jgi:hypothetical protein
MSLFDRRSAAVSTFNVRKRTAAALSAIFTVTAALVDWDG